MKIRERRMNVYERNREYVRKVKDAPCMDCGQSYPYYCMDLDHVRGEKAFNIAAKLHYATKLVVEEVAKCDVVCSNCHRIRTALRGDQLWEKRKVSKEFAYPRPQRVVQLDLTFEEALH
jgi:hypothetical protein